MARAEESTPEALQRVAGGGARSAKPPVARQHPDAPRQGCQIRGVSGTPAGVRSGAHPIRWFRASRSTTGYPLTRLRRGPNACRSCLSATQEKGGQDCREHARKGQARLPRTREERTGRIACPTSSRLQGGDAASLAPSPAHGRCGSALGADTARRRASRCDRAGARPRSGW